MTRPWVAFEGGEGSGKSTQAARFAARYGAVLSREPGGTAVGERIRAILLDPDVEMTSRTEALLMAADRAQHVASVVYAARARDQVLVSDRSAFSSIAYQGYGRGLPLDEVRHISDWASEGRWPDVVILLDVADEVRAARMQRSHDRLERAGVEFHRRVNEGFRKMAAADPARWIVIDGSPPADDVERAIADAYERWCDEHRA